MIGGGNDRLFLIMCESLGKRQWATDKRFLTNTLRVQNRELLEGMIEEVTKTKTTKEWLAILYGTGMPHAAISDIQATVSNEHGE